MTNTTINKFKEFVQTLIALSKSSEEQYKLYGVGMIGDEMAIDFDESYTCEKQNYINSGLLNSTEVQKLDLLDKYLEERSGEQYLNFWEDLEHPDWKVVREMSRNCLVLLGFDNLLLSATIDNKVEDGILIQVIKTKLEK